MIADERLTFFKLRYASGLPSPTDNIFEYITALDSIGLLVQVYMEQFYMDYCLVIRVVSSGYINLGISGHVTLSECNMGDAVHHCLDNSTMSRNVHVFAPGQTVDWPTKISMLTMFNIENRIFIEDETYNSLWLDT